MSSNDYGLFMQKMRKSRGLTQEQVVKASGISVTTVNKLENSGDQIKIRSSSLDAILTVIAMYGYLNAAEIKTISQATGRTYESLERINARAEYLIHDQGGGDLRTRPPKSAEPSREQRILSAFQLIEEAGDGDTALFMIETLAKKASDQITAENRTPKSTPPNER